MPSTPLPRRALVTGGALAIIGGAGSACAPAPPGRATASTSPRVGLAGRVRSLDAFVAGRARSGAFAGVLTVARGDAVLLDRGYGRADRATSRPVTPQTGTCIASVGKLLTAVSVCRLVQDGRIGLRDRAARHTQHLPRSWSGITVEQLLTHTSGLGDRFAGAPPTTPPATVADQLEIVTRQTPAPSGTFRYCNAGFIVLGALIEAVTGGPYAAAVTSAVLRPAGMTQTSLASWRPSAVPGSAHGVVGAEDIAGRWQEASPAGGFRSTSGDLRRLGRALLDHRLLSTAMTGEMTRGRVPVNDPRRPPGERYGLGCAVATVDAARIVGHSGGTPGYEAQLDLYLDTGLVVAMWSCLDRSLLPVAMESRRLLAGAGD